MANLTCKNCGSHEFSRKEGVYYCKRCNQRYVAKSSSAKKSTSDVKKVVSAARKYDASKAPSENVDVIARTAATAAVAVAKRAKNTKSNKAVTVLLVVLLVALVGVLVFGYFQGWFDKLLPNGGGSGGGGGSGNVGVVTGDLSIHFLMLGNKYTGDCIYVKAGDCDVLIDAGSRTSSSNTIKQYLSSYVSDGRLEYVIATHADQDHIAAFPGVFAAYETGTIIDFSQVKKEKETPTPTSVLGKYYAARDEEVAEGAVHKTASSLFEDGLPKVDEDGNAANVFTLSQSVWFEVLYNYYYDNQSTDENNHSVVVMFHHGERKFLLSGDLEKDGEERLAQRYGNEIANVQLFKAGHHGSYTSGTAVLLALLRPQICVVSCCAGNDEYTQNPERQFPSQDFINRIAPYTDKVYVTTLGAVDCLAEEYKSQQYGPMNGNVVVNSKESEIEVVCSASDALLKDTAWFLANRTMPSAWAN